MTLITNSNIDLKYSTSRNRNYNKREVYFKEIIASSYNLLLEETKSRLRAIAN